MKFVIFTVLVFLYDAAVIFYGVYDAIVNFNAPGKTMPFGYVLLEVAVMFILAAVVAVIGIGKATSEAHRGYKQLSPEDRKNVRKAACVSGTIVCELLKDRPDNWGTLARAVNVAREVCR